MNASAPPLRVAPPPLILLCAISAMQPMALNIIAPSTPALALEFNTDYATVQLTLTAYLVAVALSQLFTGPWSDRAGRRPVVLASLALFVLGSFAGAAAPTIEALIAARVVQAVGSGTAFVMARAIIRDTASRDESASRIGYMMVAMLVVPMLAPNVGSLIDGWAGWPMIFVTLGVSALGSLAIAARWLPETNVTRDPDASFGKLASAFPILLGNSSFLAYTLATCATSGMFFALVAGAPHVVVVSMGRAPHVYALWFVFMAVGYAIGNYTSGRFARSVGSERLILIGTLISLVGAAAMAFACLIDPWTPAALFVPAFIVALGNGMTIPGATASALSVRPDLAGAASGLAGCVQLGGGAAMSFLSGHVVPDSPRGLVWIMLGCAIAGALALAIPRQPPRV